MPSVVSKDTMTSGQWTMGAFTKAKLCRPVENTSPSLASTQRLFTSKGKNCSIMALVAALQTIFTSGYFSTTSARVAEWSGSMWWTIT